jgi:simple sugar transport system ATP-binding protein
VDTLQYKIEMNNITKSFGTLIANDQVTLKVKPGEIHALLGENGAGKSTLMSILFGLYQAEEGEIKIDGQIVNINNPNDATQYGIGMVHQHFKLVDTFTVLENIILGVEETKKGFLFYENSRKKLEDLIEKYNLKVNLDALIKDIHVGQQQKVEILKMLYRDSDILIFDEPTAVLTPQEIKELMSIMKNFAKEGKTILLITHKLNEIKEVADSVTVLRRGKYIGTELVKDITTHQMAEMMVGRDVSFTIEKEPVQAENIKLDIKNLELVESNQRKIKNVSFHVKSGEIVGIAGIDGNGQTELIKTISGLTPTTSGEIYIEGVNLAKSSIRKRYEQGLSHIPEDRQKYGLILDFDLQSNLILQNYYLNDFQKFGLQNKENILNHANQLIEEFDIRSEKGAKTSVRSMSGGNQQKAILSREMSKAHSILIAVQPTRGLDVGAIEYIHKKLLEERKNGKAVLLVSYELDEIMNLSDRIYVMYEGEIVAEIDPKKTSFNEMGLYMSGAKRGEAYE